MIDIFTAKTMSEKILYHPYKMFKAREIIYENFQKLD